MDFETEKMIGRSTEAKITLTISEWREATDKAINAVNESMAAADIREGKVPHAEDRMIITALGINICAELEKQFFPKL